MKEERILYTCRDNEEVIVPAHVAIIPDGNRRWARSHGYMAYRGHAKGVDVYKGLLKTAIELKIKYITFYAFSTENWKRSASEVQKLMGLLLSNIMDIRKELGIYQDNVRFRFIGDRSSLSASLRKAMSDAEEKTADNKDLTAFLAINYGGRSEIVHSVQEIARKVKSGELDPESIDEDIVNDNLYTLGAPEPDLLIRTAGEQRISNFLLWQMAYTEFVFFDKYWPDMTEDDIIEAVKIYSHRQRRFGGD